jgi:hypothetical protein
VNVVDGSVIVVTNELVYTVVMIGFERGIVLSALELELEASEAEYDWSKDRDSGIPSGVVVAGVDCPAPDDSIELAPVGPVVQLVDVDLGERFTPPKILKKFVSNG